MIWLLSFLPNWIFHLVVLTGILGLLASFFFKFIPFVNQYSLPIKIVSIVVLVIGVWFEGGISNNDAWLAKVKEMEAKIAESEVKSAKENVKIVEKIVIKDKIIKEKADEVVKYIDKEIIKYDTKFVSGGECEIPQEFIKAINDATGSVK